MRRIDWMGVAGMAMLLIGAVVFLGNNSYVPLWVAWTVGPLFWYLGFAVTLVWGFCRMFGLVGEKEESLTMTVINFRPTATKRNFGMGPVGVVHEIPSMGGFIY
jgi:hypothetical protein